MRDRTLTPFSAGLRSQWVKLRTLLVLRWFAIAGQLGAIVVAETVFGLDLPLLLCLVAVGASVAANLGAGILFPQTKRLQEVEVVSMLLFDIAQLCFLLYLTGGLHNPFALLVLAPVTISASVLRLWSTLLLGGTAITFITAVGLWHVPLDLRSGGAMAIPDDFVFGFWAAIVIGIAFIAGYARRVSIEIHAMSDALLATQAALVREQKLTDLGGVVAAAAHELGTPLATIKLVSSELADELDDLDQRSDAQLIRDQADRCRDILRSMGRAGKEDRQMHYAPLDTVLRESAEPHALRGKQMHFTAEPDSDCDLEQPLIRRQPEIIHGLRNLAQNAVDFAASTVWIEGVWTDTTLRIRISDDGPGYPAHIMGRLGDPFIHRRRWGDDRPEYEGMGLGLFIAKTLLERSGADLSFSNGTDPFLTDEEHPDRSGAIVEVSWPRTAIAAIGEEARAALGPNQAIEV